MENPLTPALSSSPGAGGHGCREDVGPAAARPSGAAPCVVSLSSGSAAPLPGLDGHCSLGPPSDPVLHPPPPPHRRALRGQRPLRPLRPRRLQERGHLREPAHRGLPLRVPPRRLREALLRGDHAQLPAPVLRHLPRPAAALPLQRGAHVSVCPPRPCPRGRPAWQQRGAVCVLMRVHAHACVHSCVCVRASSPEKVQVPFNLYPPVIPG